MADTQTVDDFTPTGVKLIKDSATSSIPLLSISEYPDDKIIYTFDNYTVTAHLTITQMVGADENMTYTVPLALLKYETYTDVTDPDNISRVSRINSLRESHNKFIMNLLSEFIEENNCGFSAHRLTLPPPPENLREMKQRLYDAAHKDKSMLIRKALEYCGKYDMYCGRDFDYDHAVDTANELAKQEQIKQKFGRIRTHIAGCPPGWWDGMQDTDSNGTRVQWKCSQWHSFLTPDVYVAEIEPDPKKYDDVAMPIESEVSDINQFDKI